MKHITTDELKQMTAEGLVLQGCGGDPDEWVSGVNEMLTQEGILLGGDTFRDIYIFEHDGFTNMLFSMEDVRLDIGKLAMWRLRSHETFSGTWLSDYLPNWLGVEMPERGTDLSDAAIDGGEPEAQPATVISQEETASGVNPPIRAYIVNTDDMTDMFADIDRREDGNFAGKWHSFPTTTAELQATLKEIGVDGVKRRDFHIHNYYTDLTDLHSRLDAHADINEFNYLTVKLMGLSESEKQIFEAVMEAGRHCDSLADIINVVENLGRFELQPAYTPEMYGAFLLETEKDETSAMFDRLKDSGNPDERAFAQYILRLEAYIDETDYGRGVVEEENGAFTKHGYLTEDEGIKEVYRGLQDIPAEYRIFAYPGPEPLMKAEDADLCGFVLKAHALGGDHMPDARYNLNVLADKRSAEYLMLMTVRNILLTEAAHAYRHGTEAFDAFMNTPESPDTRAFAIHVTDMRSGPVRGDVVEVDFAERQLDILQNNIHFTRVDATPKYGPDQSFTPEEWGKLEAIDRHTLQSWTRHFDPEDHQTVIRHLNDLRGRDETSGKAVEPDVLLADLNRRFMEKSENPQPDMLRVTLPAAKEMLARGDAVVCRLLPDGPKQLSPLDAMQSRGGLWYQQHREFAIHRSGLDGLDKWTNREAEALTRRQQERDAPKKPKSRDPEI